MDQNYGLFQETESEAGLLHERDALYLDLLITVIKKLPTLKNLTLHAFNPIAVLFLSYIKKRNNNASTKNIIVIKSFTRMFEE